MLRMVDIAFIKKMHFQEDWSIHKLSRHLGITRPTVRKAIRAKEEPRYRLSCEKPSPITGPLKGVIEQWLLEDQNQPRKQRHTARRIYDRLVNEYSFEGSESIVRKLVARLRGHLPEVFIPLSTEAGKMSQVDWGTAVVRIGGEERTVHLFVFRLRYSAVTFAHAYLHEGMEAFLDGHRRAFEWISGVTGTCVYDNLKTAVIRILSGPDREENKHMIALRSHYLFESVFCRPGKGNEKGSVENGVGYVRRNALVPVPEVRDLSELNAHLLSWCEKDRKKREKWEEESKALFPLPTFPFPCYRTSVVTVSSQLLVSLGTNRYSVPFGYQGREVICRLSVDSVDLVDKDVVLASHRRLEGKYGLGIDIHHYLPVLAKKPRAVTQMAAFNTLPAVFVRVREHLVSTRGREGWKEMVFILLLLQEYPLQTVAEVLEGMEGKGPLRADIARQILLLKKSPPAPPSPAQVPQGLASVVVPQNTPEHFDALLVIGGAA